ncbi:hypothetical protein M438DRAFT_19012 [Aureobasidium pullulans EXF-150]|uniref:Uncharacterized protein n=1 Tax=Aureobasidium pullulans EXF-150 TaxID=1043002 RepID=A0A074Y2B0_AURPU|nr:uncharacterized protein M438DRAFT_19012 [Aureobasidium pullulans EXF-150]KEQ90049.1 hypothetical protein M438DRAFT_19012 [Aureobasidium pullulans EXF-150]
MLPQIRDLVTESHQLSPLQALLLSKQYIHSTADMLFRPCCHRSKAQHLPSSLRKLRMAFIEGREAAPVNGPVRASLICAPSNALRGSCDAQLTIRLSP